MINTAEITGLERWIKRQAHATVVSEDATPFVNANTLQELGNL